MIPYLSDALGFKGIFFHFGIYFSFISKSTKESFLYARHYARYSRDTKIPKDVCSPEEKTNSLRAPFFSGFCYWWIAGTWGGFLASQVAQLLSYMFLLRRYVGWCEWISLHHSGTELLVFMEHPLCTLHLIQTLFLILTITLWGNNLHFAY